MGIGERRNHPGTIVLIALLLPGIGVARLHALGGLFLYSQHVDEVFLTAPVTTMIHNADPNPHYLR